MEERKRRIALNEMVFREVNEQIEGLTSGVLQVGDDETMSIVCECGEITCAERLTTTVSDYESIRSDALLFFVLPGHELPDVEDVVEQTDAYLVVRKRPEAIGGKIAVEHDPRSN
ncbi:MAG: hypothetical protein H0X39_10615 [Actinobacteria bacterium]|nr:hypothetical protein [Actinomycetota bacterium]